MNTGSYLAYGYQVIGALPDSGKKSFKMKFLPTGKQETWTGQRFRTYVARGLIKKVEPELLTSLYQRGGAQGWKARLTQADFTAMNLPEWNYAGIVVKRLAAKIANDMQDDLNLGHDVEINRVGNENGNKARLYAMMAIMNNFTFDRKSAAYLLITTSDGEEMFPIDEETIHLMEQIINSMFYGGEDPFLSVEKSDYAQHFQKNDWTKMEIRHEPSEKWLNFLDNRPSRHPVEVRRGRGGMFPFILLDPDINLSRFGIYSTFDEANYRTNCLVNALKEEGDILEGDIDLVKWVIKTSTVQFCDLGKIAELIEVRFHLSVWNDDENKIRKIKKYGKLGREIRLFARDEHIMLMDKTTALGGKPIWISVAIKRLFEKFKLRPMTMIEMDKALRARVEKPPVQATSYSMHSIMRVLPTRTSTGNDVNKILDTDAIKAMATEEKVELLEEFDTLMVRAFGCKPSSYSTLANLGQAIMEQEHCYIDVPLMTGPVAEFIRLCQASPLVQSAFNQKVSVTGDIVQIDRRGSYCAIYSEFPGIPKGFPITMEKFDRMQWDYYYICVNVKWFKCKLKEDAFPLLLKTGRLYLDTVMFDAIEQRYDWDYAWLGGYGFYAGFNRGIKDVAIKLWDIRMTLKQSNSPLQGVVKRLINCLFGKSIKRERLTYTNHYTEESLRRFFNLSQHDFVFSFKKCGPDDYRVKFVTGICLNWIRPQFGVNVLTFSRCMMQKRIDTACSIDCPVYYVNTDCLVMHAEDAQKLDAKANLIGTELGQFDFEFPVPARRFICVSKRSYLFCFTDGTFKVRFGPPDGEDPERYFEFRLG
jgi:hypothetical protein